MAEVVEDFGHHYSTQSLVLVLLSNGKIIEVHGRENTPLCHSSNVKCSF